MKKIFIVLVIVLLIIFAWFKLQTKPDPAVLDAEIADVMNEQAKDETNLDSSSAVKADENVNKPQAVQEISNDSVKLNFKGFGPGKTHTGTFSKITSSLISKNGSLFGEVVIDMNSMTSDNEKLTGHLKSADFFDTAKYPTASFVLDKFDGKTANGTLSIHGVKKSISFPVTMSGKEYTSTFNVDMKNFGINQTFANEVVEVSLVVPVK